MNEPKSAAHETSRPLTADTVADYLRRHPDFLLQRPELIAVLTPPAHQHGNNVTDLQSFMIERLRRESETLRQSHRELIETARGNLKGQARVHAAVLDILAAPSFEHLIEAVTTDLAVRLRVDVVRLCVEGDGIALPKTVRHGVRIVQPGMVDRLLGDGQDALLRPETQGDRRVFGSGAGLVRSDALLRLAPSPEAPLGLLAMGSRETGRFRQGQGTELLGFLARALECTIRAWLDLPA